MEPEEGMWVNYHSCREQEGVEERNDEAEGGKGMGFIHP